MKVKDLIVLLDKIDPELHVLCSCEETEVLPKGHSMRLFEVDDVVVRNAEKARGEDGVPALRFGDAENPVPHALIEISCDF